VWCLGLPGLRHMSVMDGARDATKIEETAFPCKATTLLAVADLKT